MSYNKKLPLLLVHPRLLGKYTTSGIKKELKDVANVLVTRDAPYDYALLLTGLNMLRRKISLENMRKRITEINEAL